MRRRILEVVVRVPLGWHSAAVRAAFASGDESWQCTALFCMQCIEGFDQQIFQTLESENPAIRYEALLAAGNWRLAEAWPAIDRVFNDPGMDQKMLFAVIDAAAGIGLPEAVEPLIKLLDADDDDIVDAV